MAEPKKYKIALVSDWFLPRIGGIELHIRDLAINLKKEGHNVHIITTTPGKFDLETIPIHRLNVPLLPFWKIAWNRKLIDRLREVFIENQFDLIHSHSSVITPLSYVSLYLAHLMKIPNILTNHSLLEKSVSIFKLLNFFSGWKDWPIQLTSISKAAAQGLIRASGQLNIPILSNGIYTEEWKRSKKIESPFIEITSVMRLHRKKRGRSLIEAIAEIKKNLPREIKFKLNLIGDGKERKYLQKRAKQLNLKEEICFLGLCTREKIKEVFEKTDLFALPTIKEAFGIAVLEAKSAGIPVVAMKYGGVKDIIQHEKDGFLANNDKEFVSYLLQLIQNKPLREQMAENTKNNLLEFDWKQIIQKHIQIYEKTARLSYSRC